jgi:hypothetical protein
MGVVNALSCCRDWQKPPVVVARAGKTDLLREAIPARMCAHSAARDDGDSRTARGCASARVRECASARVRECATRVRKDLLTRSVGSPPRFSWVRCSLNLSRSSRRTSRPCLCPRGRVEPSVAFEGPAALAVGYGADGCRRRRRSPPMRLAPVLVPVPEPAAPPLVAARPLVLCRHSSFHRRRLARSPPWPAGSL